MCIDHLTHHDVMIALFDDGNYPDILRPLGRRLE